jgi:S-adenosylhomocysteine hydrolase
MLLKVVKPLNMILDDGGDLTNMVFDRYPELAKDIVVFLKKLQQVFTVYTKERKKELYYYLLSISMILLLNLNLITNTVVKNL